MYMIILVPRIFLRFRQASKYVSQTILKALESAKELQTPKVVQRRRQLHSVNM